MEARYGAVQRIWVMDRGMTSAASLAWLRQTERRYLVGTPKSELRKWAAQIAETQDWFYSQLTDAEAAFRIQKSEPAIRPIWHQREDRVKAHILVCFLAYVLWKTT